MPINGLVQNNHLILTYKSEKPPVSVKAYHWLTGFFMCLFGRAIRLKVTVNNYKKVFYVSKRQLKVKTIESLISEKKNYSMMIKRIDRSAFSCLLRAARVKKKIDWFNFYSRFSRISFVNFKKEMRQRIQKEEDKLSPKSVESTAAKTQSVQLQAGEESVKAQLSNIQIENEAHKTQLVQEKIGVWENKISSNSLESGEFEKESLSNPLDMSVINVEEPEWIFPEKEIRVITRTTVFHMASLFDKSNVEFIIKTPIKIPGIMEGHVKKLMQPKFVEEIMQGLNFNLNHKIAGLANAEGFQKMIQAKKNQISHNGTPLEKEISKSASKVIKTHQDHIHSSDSLLKEEFFETDSEVDEEEVEIFAEKEKQIVEIAKLADEGDTQPEVLLAAALVNQYGFGEQKPDIKKAIQFFEHAALQGNAEAKRELGKLYEKGKDVDIDVKKAFKLYLEAAMDGDAGAQYQVGSMYAEGTAGVKNASLASIWFKKAAEQGDELAQISLGLLHSVGKVPKDPQNAVKWNETIEEEDSEEIAEVEKSKKNLDSEFQETEDDLAPNDEWIWTG